MKLVSQAKLRREAGALASAGMRIVLPAMKIDRGRLIVHSFQNATARYDHRRSPTGTPSEMHGSTAAKPPRFPILQASSFPRRTCGIRPTRSGWTCAERRGSRFWTIRSRWNLAVGRTDGATGDKFTGAQSAAAEDGLSPLVKSQRESRWRIGHDRSHLRCLPTFGS